MMGRRYGRKELEEAGERVGRARDKGSGRGKRGFAQKGADKDEMRGGK